MRPRDNAALAPSVSDGPAGKTRGLAENEPAPPGHGTCCADGMRSFLLWALLASLGCSSAEPEIVDADNGELGEAARPQPPAGLDPLTHFKCKEDRSKDCPVDLTSYVGAG